MLTPARNANSRWRGSPGTSGSVGAPSGRVAQAPARSFDVMMIDDTPSPPRAGRLVSCSSSSRSGFAQRLDPELAGGETSGKIAQQEERLGEDVIFRHRLELGNIQRRQDRAQRHHAGAAGFTARSGRCHHRVASVEQNGAALFHVGVDAGERLGRRLWRAWHDRPVDQREERELIAADIDADRIAGLERGALGQKQGQALQAGFAHGIRLGVAGHDIGEVGLDGGLGGELIGRRVGLGEGRRAGERETDATMDAPTTAATKMEEAAMPRRGINR